ncbi:helix-turn-helix domain-containing protein [Salibacteraceae bacterium]|nr:helix-turn-helix domain-containing protein [Salibacteraceae bacterium]
MSQEHFVYFCPNIIFKMKYFGEKMRDLRVERKLPLRKVAAYLDIDTSILSKIERGEREASREIVTKAAEFFNIKKAEFLTNFFSEQVARIIYQEEDCDKILKVAEEKIKYIKAHSLKQGDLNFGNE